MKKNTKNKSKSNSVSSKGTNSQSSETSASNVGKILIPRDGSKYFCKTLGLHERHPIIGVYENAIEALEQMLEDGDDGELSTTESQLKFVSNSMTEEIHGNYRNDLNFAESVVDMETAKTKKKVS